MDDAACQFVSPRDLCPLFDTDTFLLSQKVCVDQVHGHRSLAFPLPRGSHWVYMFSLKSREMRRVNCINAGINNHFICDKVIRLRHSPLRIDSQNFEKMYVLCANYINIGREKRSELP